MSLPDEVTVNFTNPNPDKVLDSLRDVKDYLHQLKEEIHRMSDALAGIQTDEQELASLVPEVLTTLTAVQGQLATATAAGTPVDPTELASIQSGLDGVVTQLQGAVPATILGSAQEPAQESTPEPTQAPAESTPAPVDTTRAPEGGTPTV
jgi:hypothetical protein